MRLILFFISFLLFCITTPSTAQISQKLLLIGIDGCRPDALTVANTPNIDALIQNSTYSLDALNTGITISGPGWSNLLTGVWHDKHGVTDNSFTGSNYGAYPHFFQRIEAYNSTLNTASICHWNPINDNVVQDLADFKINVGSDLEVANQAADYLSNNQPDALFLHFDDVDHAGHANGFSPDVAAYISSIEDIDAHIGTVMTALTNRSTFTDENWMILLTTDHGGLNFSHGGTSFEERNIFIIASGDQIPNQEITKELLPAPNNCLGGMEELYFDGSGDYVSVPNTGLFDFGTSQDFTIECRVRTDNAADVSIVGNKDWDSGGNPGFVLSFKFASGPEWKVNIGDGSSRVDINTGGEIADNNWHTLSVTFDRDGLMSMYEDGIFLTASDISTIGDINTNFDLRFGADGLGSYAYRGAIAEVRVWNKVLDASAINNWFCTEIDPTHPDESSLIGYWKMKADEGTSLVSDASGNHNHGQINGATWQSPVSYDYSNTPRQVDVAVTALTHLCVPVEVSWNLDGNSLVSECNTLSTQELALTLNFEATHAENDILLHWTSFDRDVSSFEIERSSDASSFVKIGDLAAHDIDQYRFIDKKTIPYIAYYRLKIMDHQGTFYYSDILTVPPFYKNKFKIFPNPSTIEEIFLSTDSQFKNIQIKIYNLSGKQVHQQFFPSIHHTPKAIDVRGLSPGIYWMTMIGNQTIETQKLIIY